MPPPAARADKAAVIDLTATAKKTTSAEKDQNKNKRKRKGVLECVRIFFLVKISGANARKKICSVKQTCVLDHTPMTCVLEFCTHLSYIINYDLKKRI
jgi:hypothetical protein